MRGLVFLVAIWVMAGPALAGSVLVFETDFDSGLPAEFSGAGGVVPAGSFSGIGHPGRTFGGDLYWNANGGNPAPATVLTLTGLPPHSHLTVDFLLGVVDSWDGNTGPFAPDYLNIVVDGSPLFHESFDWTNDADQSYEPPPGARILERTEVFGSFSYPDSAYDLSRDPGLLTLAHTQDTLVVEWFASGAGWQGLIDESFVLDNVSVSVETTDPANVPEPATLVLAGLGLLAVAGRRRRRSP